MQTFKLGTRGSQLALFQAHSVAGLLRDRAGVVCEIVVIKTSGDRLAEASLSEIGGKRLFVKEIEDALLSGEIDLAVHSSKDMPAVLPGGLRLGAVLPREDPRDAVVLPAEEGTSLTLDDVVKRLGRAPRIGTSSVRRTAQLTRLFPGARFLPVRGNLGTRLAKVDARKDFDALVLAAAGLKRLGHEMRISAVLPIEACVPAPGQGIIAVEVREGDTRALEPLTSIADAPATAALTAERAVVTRLGGGCQMPIGAYAALQDGELVLSAIVVSVDGAQAARADVRGPVADSHAIGIRAADQLLARGAGEILASVQREHGAVEGLQP
jgi:hydroxymethylbilane synthase